MVICFFAGVGDAATTFFGDVDKSLECFKCIVNFI